MVNILKIIFLLIVLNSCSGKINKERHKNWKTVKLTSQWNIKVPNEFKVQRFNGIDSEIGSIYSKKDSVNIEFETWIGLKETCKECEKEYKLKKYKKEISTLKRKNKDAFSEYQVEEINDNLFILIIPKTKCGDYFLLGDNCNSIKLKCTQTKKNKLIEEIFRTLIKKEAK
jgi:hypothetical protein